MTSYDPESSVDPSLPNDDVEEGTYNPSGDIPSHPADPQYEKEQDNDE